MLQERDIVITKIHVKVRCSFHSDEMETYGTAVVAF
jgi:hypothetical protein